MEPQGSLGPPRCSLDFQEDLDMFEKLLFKIDGEPITTKKIFEILDHNPSISKINSHILLKYKTDKKLINSLNKATKIPLSDSS